MAATMSDDGEKTCPLCAEEMDLTDQQLKPCKCGYEICVWCWHHIMEMAEKEGAEGRCPACRTPYDKEKIVAANCERAVAVQKQKAQRAKPKASAEARKHLTGVRVIKRNLVYIIGLPNYLADESSLERKEYFGQYGKVLKVSISRPNTPGSAQQASNNSTFGVYITFAREEEAIRCIQAVNNFVLEGNPLRACFGTTKYCHVWLRNMTCTNPYCLYLHDVDSQEDSFTKDEILSAYTRSRVPENASNNVQHRAGHILPPPVDDLCNNGAVSGKLAAKSASNTTSVQAKGSSGIASFGKSPVLPAAASWGSRVSTGRPQSAGVASSQDPAKHKIETINSPFGHSSLSASTKQSSSWHDDEVISSGGHTSYTNNKFRHVESIKPGVNRDSYSTASVSVPRISSWDDDIVPAKMPEGMHAKVSSSSVDMKSSTRGNVPSVDVKLDNVMDDVCRSAWDDDEVTVSLPEGGKPGHMNDNVRPSDTTKANIDRDSRTSVSDISLKNSVDASHTAESSMSCTSTSMKPLIEKKDKDIDVLQDHINSVNNTSPEVSERRSSGFMHSGVSNGFKASAKIEKFSLCFPSVNVDDHPAESSGMVSYSGSSLHRETSSALLGDTLAPSAHVTSGPSESNLDMQVHVLSSSGTGMEDSLLASDNKNERDSHTSNHSSYIANEDRPVRPLDILECSSNSFWDSKGDTSLLSNGNARTSDTEVVPKLSFFRENGPALSNTQNPEPSSFDFRNMAKYLGKSDDVSNASKIPSADMGESDIFTGIPSLDFDPWAEALPSGNNFSKLLGEIDGQDGCSKPVSSWKVQNTNQSRFSFARQEDQSDYVDSSVRRTADTDDLCSFPDYTNNSHHLSQINSINGSINVSPAVFPDTTSAARSKVSAPPGFAVPSRAPPPGFSSHGRYGLPYETTENQVLGHSPLRNQYHDHSVGNASDVEFIDPAILAVGKGILPLGVNNSGFGSQYGFPSQFSSDYDLKLHLLKQQAIAAQQDLRFAEHVAAQQDLRYAEHVGDRFLPLSDAYLSSRIIAQNHRQSPFSHMPTQQSGGSHIMGGQWDGWNGTPMNNTNMHMAELLKNERFGLVNGHAPYNEDHKFRGQTSSDMYTRSFGR